MSDFLKVSDLKKTYNTKPVLKGINLSLKRGELFSLVGPSGAGKTTFLKILSGLESPDSGSIQSFTTINEKKGAILVFQEYLLFPHMTVKDNLLFGLKARKLLDKQKRNIKVSEYLSYFSLSDKADEYPEHLSGGQRQRVALARAMILEPELLLLDEPFANLDKNLKTETAEFIRATVKDFGITAVIVTHDLEEAAIISDRLGIFLDGKLRQIGTVQDLYHNPADLEIASFLGPVNNISSDILSSIGSLEKSESGKDIYARAQSMEILKDADGEGIIESIEHRGTYMSISVNISGKELIIHSFKNGFSKGDKVKISLNSYFISGGT